MKRIYIIGVLLILLSLNGLAQQTKQLVILQTSDVHSRVEPIDVQAADRNAGMAGMVRRATLLEQVRKENSDLFLFDCGDFSQGTPYYNLFQGEVEVEMMNLMKYDAVAVGNHEFDFGMDNMARLFRLADFPIVCANYDFTGTVLEDLVKPYVILERNGLKVGVFGLGIELEGRVQADNCQGVLYLNPVTKAQEVADLLKAKGCDVVICLSHLGLRGDGIRIIGDENLVQQTNHIDAVLGGHSHTFMNEPAFYLNKDGENVPVLHSGKSGIYVGKLKLTLTEK